MTNKVQWNVSTLNEEEEQEIDDSMLPTDPSGYVPTAIREPETPELDAEAVGAPEDWSEEQEEQDNAAILGNARLRLETGRLYEMLYASDIFANLDADAQAIKNVQRELRRFAKDRMEVMLGMKKVVEENTTYAQFNSLEVEVLKSLAKKLSGGASATAPQATGPSQPPKNTGLTPISNGNKTKAVVKAVVTAKINPTKVAAKPQQAPAPTAISPELASKSIEEMTYDEKVEYNRQKSAIYNARKAVNPDAIPMPSIEGMNALNSRGALNPSGMGHPTLNKIAANMLRR